MFWQNNRFWQIGLVCKASSVASHQTRWHNKRILIKGYSILRDFSWIENSKLILMCKSTMWKNIFPNMVMSYTILSEIWCRFRYAKRPWLKMSSSKFIRPLSHNKAPDLCTYLYYTLKRGCLINLSYFIQFFVSYLCWFT